MHFSHLLYLVKIDHKAPFVSVVFFDTLPAEDSVMVGAVEVLDSLVVPLTKKTLDNILVLKIKLS